MTGRTDHLFANDITTGAPVLGSPALRLRMNFAAPNLMAAAMYARRVGEIESKHSTESMGPFWDEILAHATACIFLAVAGLESYANELFADGERNFPDTPRAVTDLLWESYEQRKIADKFNAALELRGKAALETGVEPAQSMEALVSLRNALMHFKPEWDDEQSAHKKLSSRLRDKFEPSPFLRSDPGLFPRAWASHSCTRWAINSVRRFLEHFEARAGLNYKIATFADRLRT